MSEELVAKPKSKIFESDDSLYKVIKAKTKSDEDIILVGFFPSLTYDIYYRFIGEKTINPKYGVQFKVETYKRDDLNDKDGIILYLSSGLIKGVGIKSAEKIYELLGDNAINEIINDKNVLKAIKGFSQEKINTIYDSLILNQRLEKAYVELYSYGLTPNMVGKFYQQYGDNTLPLIKENPYRLIYEVSGFGFSKADNLALSFGFSRHSKKRIEEGVLYTLYEVCEQKGFTFLTDNQLINSSIQILNKGAVEVDLVQNSEVIDAITLLIKSQKFIKEDNRYYPKALYEAECSVASNILRIKGYDKNKIYSLDMLNEKLKDVEATYNIRYTEGQKDAIFSAINNNISIITGGPGTGKTTIVKGILNLLAVLNNKSITDDKFRHRLVLCAPTGRAALRLGHQCMVEAQTIHKTLGYNYALEFEYNESHKINGDIIVIDEFSMVDVELCDALFKAIKTEARVIIVGDSNQLPSVGPGNVLYDLIESNIINTTKLTDIMRQDDDSSIIELCQGVSKSFVPYNLFNKKSDLYFYPADSTATLEKILIFVQAFLNKGGSILNDLQILAPMYAGPCGINAINKAIQDKFNDETISITRGSRTFKRLDKVLQLKNDPEKGIMNGDIGYIDSISHTDEMDYLMIRFDNILVKYPAKDLDDLTLAYAISIHKSQGSEYKNVIMPILSDYFVMMKRKLIYTAFSRAKEKLILIGDYKILAQAVKRTDDIRQTTLYNRLYNKSSLTKKVIYIDDPNIPFSTLGEEGMEGITPYTFMTKD